MVIVGKVFVGLYIRLNLQKISEEVSIKIDPDNIHIMATAKSSKS